MQGSPSNDKHMYVFLSPHHRLFYPLHICGPCPGGSRTACGIPAYGHMVAGLRRRLPPAVEAWFKAPSFLQGDVWGVVTPCHTTRLAFPLKGPVRSLPRVWSHCPFGASPAGAFEAEQHVGIPALEHMVAA